MMSQPAVVYDAHYHAAPPLPPPHFYPPPPPPRHPPPVQSRAFKRRDRAMKHNALARDAAAAHKRAAIHHSPANTVEANAVGHAQRGTQSILQPAEDAVVPRKDLNGGAEAENILLEARPCLDENVDSVTMDLVLDTILCPVQLRDDELPAWAAHAERGRWPLPGLEGFHPVPKDTLLISKYAPSNPLTPSRHRPSRTSKLKPPVSSSR